MNLSFSRHRLERVDTNEHDDSKQLANTPSLDIHAAHVKNLETFVKTSFEDLGEDGGISFEIDPVKHREVAKRLSPAFSTRHTKAKEAVLHKYVDFFVDKMKEIGERMALSCASGQIG